MSIVAFQPVQQAGVGVFLYYADSDHNLYALDMNGANVALSGGAYHPVFTGGQPVEDHRKRAKRLEVYGTGQGVSAQLVLEMDGERTLIQNLVGPYDANAGLLFYCEFDPAVATGQTFVAKLDAIAGTNVEIRDTRLYYTRID